MNLIADAHTQLEATSLVSTAEVPHDEHHAHVEPPAFYSVIPFAALLLCIAFLPLIHKTEEWWEHNKNRLLVAVSLGLVTLLYYTFLYGHGVVDHVTHEISAPGFPAAIVVLKNALLVEYIPFIALLFSLYVISGGIAFNGHLVGRPGLNTGIIAIGAAIASFIGTTGAAMLLIRPLLKANEKRDYVAHTVIFFIFVVCNTGGCLLPIGDPPLFLGFLRGVPFTWTLSLWPMWLAMNLSLLAVYFVFDTIRYKKENKEKVEAPPEVIEPFSLKGSINFFWLLLVIFCVAVFDPSKPVPGTDWHAPSFFREACMFALAGISLLTTSKMIRKQNSFNYEAILEVAALFVGIFICMQAPVQILNVNGAALGIDSPWKFYWATGVLSSFLDNAPTYVVFFETAKAAGTNGPAVAGVNEVSLVAISLGAVFMGAMTYIGNGPNFMVKAIAEKNNIRMPSFFGFMAYSCVVLLPLSVILTFVFLV
ncbi:sodium:proton antiporter [uncultured Gimesia sp.]|uniref:sodium:proton antiporter n=1 Tax=uncultured Gimesia sp. TaxID=1678688 RepID=UPI0030DA5CE4|tara:strand:+ start:28660 stop:30096 length:1437 start_codon:yes stop_codon:yes gene_type:complete